MTTTTELLNRTSQSMTTLRAARTAMQAKSAAASCHRFLEATVSPAAMAANRRLYLRAISANHFAQYTAEIAVLESRYTYMLAQNTEAMCRYAASLATISLLPRCPTPSQGQGVEAVRAGDDVTVGIRSGQVVTWPPDSEASPPTTRWDLDSLADLWAWDMPMSESYALRILDLLPQPSGLSSEEQLRDSKPMSGTLVRASSAGQHLTSRGRRREANRSAAQAAPPLDIGPAATVGKLSVPLIWLVRAETSSAAHLFAPAPQPRLSTDECAAQPIREM